MTGAARRIGLAMLLASGWVVPARAEEESFEVRGHHWGMSPEEVTKTEKSKDIRTIDKGPVHMLIIIDQLAQIEVGAILGFQQNKLFELLYADSGKYTCPQLEAAFGTLKAELSGKYGDPIEGRPSGDLCEQNLSWRVGTTSITMSVKRVNSQPRLFLRYWSSDVAAEVQDDREEKSKVSDGKKL